MFRMNLYCSLKESKATESTTTPICEIVNGMNSDVTIPSKEIYVSDNMAKVHNLRPTSKVPFISSQETLVIEYTPSNMKPVEDVELINTENIKTYTVTFFYDDGTETTRKVMCDSF